MASNNPHQKLGSTQQCPYQHQHCGHFFSPPSCSQPKPLRPLINNIHASAIVMVGALNLATASNANGAHRRSKTIVVDPPKGLRAAHVPTAFPTAAAVTELPDDVNRSIVRTYCAVSTGDGPYAAAGIVACNRIVIVTT